MPTDKPIVTEMTQDTMLDANSKPVPAIKVMFTVGKHGPFIVRVPKSDTFAQEAQKAMNDFAQQVGLLVN